MATVRRPKWIREQVARRDALARYAGWVRCQRMAASRGDDAETVSAYQLRERQALDDCRRLGCSEAEIAAARKRVGCPDPAVEAEQREYLDSIAAGLPEELAAIVRGQTCRQ